MPGTRKTQFPLLFSRELVGPIRKDRKTQTRRVVVGTALKWLAPDMFKPEVVADPDNHLSPYGYRGDFLYVRESHWQYGTWMEHYPNGIDDPRRTFVRYYRDDAENRLLGFKFSCCKPLTQFAPTPPEEGGPDWFYRPSIFLPKWASRIWLENRGVRIEPLLDITTSDAMREGVRHLPHTDAEGNCFDYRGEIGPDARTLFLEGWDDINGKRGHGTETNPMLWVVDFVQTERQEVAA